MPICFGDCLFDRDTRTLTRGGRAVELPPKLFELLSALLDSRPRPLSKQELHQRLWPESFVTDTSLARLVSELRKALGDEAREPRFVRTVHGYGYAFSGSVTTGKAAGPAGAAGTVVVLPFVDLGGGPGQDYLCDGLTEELIHELGRLRPRGPRVIARTSAMSYKGSSKSVRQIGQELGVEHALEGSVRRAGGRVRIVAQLVRVADQLQLWSESYEAELGDLVAVQREVVRALAGELWPQLAPPHRQSPQPLDPGAHEAYLKGRYFWHRRTVADLEKGIRCFEQAIDRVPSYAAAHTGLADTYLTLLDYHELEAREAMQRAKLAVADALRCDPDLAEAHSTLGHISIHAFDWPAAESAFRRALELNPSYAMAHFYYANYLAAMGRFEEAIEEARVAIALDPVAPVCRSNAAFVGYHAGRFEEAIERARQALEMEPHLWFALCDLGQARLALGQHAAAIEALERAVQISERSHRALAALGHARAIVGEASRAEAILDQLREPEERSPPSAYGTAVVLLGLGRTDEAFGWLERAYENLEASLVFLAVDPRVRPHLDHPRARTLLGRLGLAPA